MPVLATHLVQELNVGIVYAVYTIANVCFNRYGTTDKLRRKL